MRSRAFFLTIVILVGAGAIFWRRNQIAIDAARQLPTEHEPERPQVTNFQTIVPIRPAPDHHPSAALLELRAEVTALRNELDSIVTGRISAEQASNDWALVHSGPKPSDLPGFISFKEATNVGFATPESAFQSFNYEMRHPPKEPVDEAARTMELWDVPDDWAEPGPKSIDIGEGIGAEVGYRVVSQEILATNQIKLIVDFEKPDGSSFRRSKVLVKHNDRWRMKPVSITVKKPSR
jgi:hypothetical protein